MQTGHSNYYYNELRDKDDEEIKRIEEIEDAFET